MNKHASCFEVLIFDWDGTVCDSLGHIVDSLRVAIRRAGMPARDEAALKSIIGLGLHEAMTRLFEDIDPEQRDKLVRYYREYYFEHTGGNTRVFPGVADTVRTLHGQGHTLAIATGKSRRGLDRALSESGLGEYFHFSRCADETFSKPHPQMLQEIIDYSSCKAKETLMIGDSEHDLQMALNAGVSAVAVSYGAQNLNYLLKFRPVASFDSLVELPGWLAEYKIPENN